VKVLKEQLGKKPRFSDDQRRRLAGSPSCSSERGLFMPVWVDRVEETDLPQLLSFLHRHWEYLREIWKPVSEHGYEES
jgi:hypothetical protein